MQKGPEVKSWNVAISSNIDQDDEKYIICFMP
jgi:hypothetical protein